jgi:nucleotidyltransferase substrate binding protein (TIGR01987 family)
MSVGRHEKLDQALHDLERALESYSPSSKERSLTFLAASKAFEVSIEYAWKYFKVIIEDQGLEAFSPKDVARQAASMNLISDPELWIKAINARNQSVHDYFSMSEDTFIQLAKDFLKVTRLDLRELSLK